MKKKASRLKSTLQPGKHRAAVLASFVLVYHENLFCSFLVPKLRVEAKVALVQLNLAAVR